MTRGRLWGCLAAVLAIVAVLTLVVAQDRPAAGPIAPYDHGGFGEVSMATEDVVVGEASTAVAGLVERGFWCVQPRSNELAFQVSCRSPARDVQLDLMAAPDGDVLYAGIELGAVAGSASVPDIGERPREVLDASLLELWPQDRTTVRDLFEAARSDPSMPFGGDAPPADPDDQYVTHHERTDNATWSVWSRYTGEPLALRVSTPALEDRSWPFDGSHYATSVDAATTALVADGFTCGTSCSRARDGQIVDFDEHDGQIVAVRFLLRSSVDGDRRTDASGGWVRAGLPFLTAAVQAAVGDRVEQCRIEQRSCHGVVAGTPIDVVAVPGAAVLPGDRPATEVQVTIGVPLVPVG